LRSVGYLDLFFIPGLGPGIHGRKLLDFVALDYPVKPGSAEKSKFIGMV